MPSLSCQRTSVLPASRLHRAKSCRYPSKVLGQRTLVTSSPRHTVCKTTNDDLLMTSYDEPAPGTNISESPEWQDLVSHVSEIKETHLKDLIQDEKRIDALCMESDGVYADFSRQRVTTETKEKLLALAGAAKLREKMDQMFAGERINVTEDRPVLHTALRAPRKAIINVDGTNAVKDVWEVLDRIKDFSDRVRNGEWVGITGKPLKNVVCVGIGGSYLGPLFVHTALATDQTAMVAAKGRVLRFLANVDPIDVAKALKGLDQEETLVVVVSKTFTTAETMLNARTVRTWLVAKLGLDAIPKHMVAVSTNKKLVKQFGIDTNNMFGFWDWVGGRYSVCSAVGIVPLALQYGFAQCELFLEGAHSMDEHFRTAEFHENIPVMMGLFSVWNSTFLGYSSRAILPYCQALSKLPPHIQQVAMESNGKGVDINGQPLPYKAGEVDFGEPGTNGQHSFYQLIHQGRPVPAEFIGVVRSQQSVYLKGEIVSNHDELMCNFFAQADALAIGKAPVELRSENVPDMLIPHKTFTGNRPSMSIMLPELNAYTVGQLLALYEDRIAVQGFIWNINSFDQWGVELGKVLASKVRVAMNGVRSSGTPLSGFNESTMRLMTRYLDGKTELKYPEPRDVFPSSLLDTVGVEHPSAEESHGLWTD